MYAKDKVRPKLFDLDQDKISRLFSDLRRESLATGSFPITIRHLESIIRMSEASAKMALREYVRADDIDLAISVTIGSFVNAQKMSIKKTLERVSPIFDPYSHKDSRRVVSNRPTSSLYLVLSCGKLVVARRVADRLRAIGLPQVPHAGARPRGVARVPSRANRQGEGALLSAAEALAARFRYRQDHGAGRTGKLARLPCATRY